MHRLIAKILGVLLALLGVMGLLLDGERLFGFMNVDLALDIVRLLIAAAMLYVGFGPLAVIVARATLGVVGGLYVLMGLMALADETLFGVLPTGFTGFDIGFHLVVGAAALVLACIPPRVLEPASREADPR